MERGRKEQDAATITAITTGLAMRIMSVPAAPYSKSAAPAKPKGRCGTCNTQGHVIQATLHTSTLSLTSEHSILVTEAGSFCWSSVKAELAQHQARTSEPATAFSRHVLVTHCFLKKCENVRCSMLYTNQQSTGLNAVTV